MAKEKIRFTITSADLSDAYSFDCQKWIRNLASKEVKIDDLQRLFAGKFPEGKLFILDMMEFLRKQEPHLDRFLLKRGGIKNDDLFSIEFADVRQMLNNEFPELASRIAAEENKPKILKRRPKEVDLSPLKKLNG